MFTKPFTAKGNKNNLAKKKGQGFLFFKKPLANFMKHIQFLIFTIFIFSQSHFFIHPPSGEI